VSRDSCCSRAAACSAVSLATSSSESCTPLALVGPHLLKIGVWEGGGVAGGGVRPAGARGLADACPNAPKGPRPAARGAARPGSHIGGPQVQGAHLVMRIRCSGASSGVVPMSLNASSASAPRCTRPTTCGRAGGGGCGKAAAPARVRRCPTPRRPRSSSRPPRRHILPCPAPAAAARAAPPTPRRQPQAPAPRRRTWCVASSRRLRPSATPTSVPSSDTDTAPSWELRRYLLGRSAGAAAAGLRMAAGVRAGGRAGASALAITLRPVLVCSAPPRAPRPAPLSSPAPLAHERGVVAQELVEGRAAERRGRAGQAAVAQMGRADGV
jgi:hypothetical protein